MTLLTKADEKPTKENCPSEGPPKVMGALQKSVREEKWVLGLEVPKAYPAPPPPKILV